MFRRNSDNSLQINLTIVVQLYIRILLSNRWKKQNCCQDSVGAHSRIFTKDGFQNDREVWSFMSSNCHRYPKIESRGEILGYLRSCTCSIWYHSVCQITINTTTITISDAWISASEIIIEDGKKGQFPFLCLWLCQYRFQWNNASYLVCAAVQTQASMRKQSGPL